MGCVHGCPHQRRQMALQETPGVATIAFRQRGEKMPNHLNPSNKEYGSGRKKSNQRKNGQAKDTVKSDLESQNHILAELKCLDVTGLSNDVNCQIFPRESPQNTCKFCGCRCQQRKKNKKKNKGDRETVHNNLRHSSSLANLAGHAFANILAMNALDLTAPASDALLKNRKNAWVQLAGHPGSFAPAGPNTIWKRRGPKDNNETNAYQELMSDVCREVVPKFYREVEYNSEYYIEMEDLLQNFNDPNIMDIKMGSRTFLESEVKNPVLRKDLYEKMIKLSPDEPSDEEHEQKAITKLRYMQFREKGSSTSTLGFRIEAIKKSGESPNTDLKKVKSRQEVMKFITKYLNSNETVRTAILHRLRDIRTRFSASEFFKNHEIIGSSLLFMYDKNHKASVWLIDFAKTLRMEDGRTLNHRDEWQLGNHEDGYLTGLNSLIKIYEDLSFKGANENFPPVSVGSEGNATSRNNEMGTSTDNRDSKLGANLDNRDSESRHVEQVELHVETKKIKRTSDKS